MGKQMRDGKLASGEQKVSQSANKQLNHSLDHRNLDPSQCIQDWDLD